MTRTRDVARPADWQKTRTGTGSLRSPNLSLSANTAANPHIKNPEKHEREFGETNTSRTRRKEYEQPRGLVAAFLWRLWIKTQTTFALSMLETWEIVLIFVITGSITLLFTAALIRLLPRILLFVSQQAHFFLDSFGFGFGLQVADIGGVADLVKDVMHGE